jgi:hypothetical protein
MDMITESLLKVSMEEEDIDLYSSPYDNYLRLLKTIETIENKFRLTEDWYEEHKKHILKYREEFPNLKFINQDVEDKEFRKKADEAEVLISSLVNEITTTKTFTLKLYLLLNKRLKELTEIILGEDELLNMLQQMRM